MKNAPLPPFSPSNTALVLHDMQNGFLQGWQDKPEMVAVVKRTRELIDLAHSLNMPVIYTMSVHDPRATFPESREPYLHRHSPPVCVRGEPSGEIIDELKPGEQDFVVTKARSSAFVSTNMEALLRIKERWILAVAGGSVNWGVEWLARDAKARDLVTVALRDCVYSREPEPHKASLANIDDFIGYVMDSAEVEQKLRAAAGR